MTQAAGGGAGPLARIEPKGMTPEQLEAAEAVIERGLETFVQVGQALMAIRDGRGYRHVGFQTFEDYCRERWQMPRQHAYRLMDAAKVVGVLSPMGDIPTTERQARELVRLLREGPEAVAKAWFEALETATDGRVTAAHVRSMVSQASHTPKPLPEPREASVTPMLRFSPPDMTTAQIVSGILRVCFPDARTALDTTYGLGGFWDGTAHVEVTALDGDPARGLHGVADFQNLPQANSSYDVVLFDPPQLPDGGTDSIMAERYTTYTAAELQEIIRQGACEAWRVARLGVVIKVTDHVHGQLFVSESDWVREAIGVQRYEVAHQTRPRPMVDPKWGQQLSLYNNGSTYLIFRKDTPRHIPRERREAA